VISAAAAQSFSSQASLSVRVSGLMGTATAPAPSTPQKETAASTLFSANTSTRSPVPTPRRRSAHASWWARVAHAP
jgi:hypothetical protein